MGRFTIKEVELLTGVKAHTLRIWEQRYSILQPKRTETNIRYYDDEDLKRLLNISLLNSQGHKISEISKLSDAEICNLAVKYSIISDKHSVHIQSMISAMINLDEAAFEKVLSTSILQYGLQQTVMEVIFPLMENIGLLWQTGTVNPAYEHFVTNLVRQKLLVAIDGFTGLAGKSQKKVLLFLPEGESHELGLLFANYLIRSAGHHTLYLGQSLPVADILRAASKYAPDYFLTSITTAYPMQVASAFMNQIRTTYPDKGILATGRYFTYNPPEEAWRLTLIQRPGDLISALNLESNK